MIRVALLALAALLVAGCMTVDAVKMRHPTTKETATCGPYAFKFSVGVDEQKRCIADFQRQGYERAPN